MPSASEPGNGHAGWNTPPRRAAGGTGTTFKPCAAQAAPSGDRAADRSLSRRRLDRHARPSLQGPQNNRDAPPCAGRHRPATHGPQDDRPIRFRGRSTVRGGRVACSCGERVRCARSDLGEGVPRGASTDPTPTRLALLIVTSAQGSRPNQVTQEGGSPPSTSDPPSQAFSESSVCGSRTPRAVVR